MPKLQPLTSLFNKFPCTSGCLGGALDCLLNCVPAASWEPLSSAARGSAGSAAVQGAGRSRTRAKVGTGSQAAIPAFLPARGRLADIPSHTLQGQAVYPFTAVLPLPQSPGQRQRSKLADA